MESHSTPSQAEAALRRGKARRNALLLGLLALGVYVGFIALQLLHARGG